MIKLSKTYEVITPESAEQGNVAARGFRWEGREFGFRDLVRALKYDGFCEVSFHPATYAECLRHAPWVTDSGDTDYRTGAETRENLHLDDDRNPRARRYWAKALLAAGLITL